MQGSGCRVRVLGCMEVHYLRLIDFCITQLKAHGPSRTCHESKEQEEKGFGVYLDKHRVAGAARNLIDWGLGFGGFWGLGLGFRV